MTREEKNKSKERNEVYRKLAPLSGFRYTGEMKEERRELVLTIKKIVDSTDGYVSMVPELKRLFGAKYISWNEACEYAEEFNIEL